MRKETTVKLRMSETMKAYVDAQCGALGLTVSEYIRGLIFDAMRSKNPPTPPYIVSSNTEVSKVNSNTDTSNTVSSMRNSKKKEKKESNPNLSRESYQQLVEFHFGGWSEAVRLVLMDWFDYRVAKKKNMQEASWVAQFKKLSDLAPHKLIECVTDSIANGYQGLFPDKYKTDGTTKTGQQTTRGRFTPDEFEAMVAEASRLLNGGDSLE